RFRWSYEKPYEQLLVGDGQRLWIFDRDLNQVTVKKLGQALGASPAALLAGDNALDKNFIITDAGTTDGLEFVEAMPRNKDEGSFELVRIGLSDNLPRLMIVHDHFGQKTVLTFHQFERNPPLAADLFRFTPPKGADVIGE
nr:outer membrane lipoprotein carrier protein LolA [Sterolibacterium sp.]